MLELIGSLLPQAVGIAVSPVPVIAVVLMLMSPRARTAGPAFVLGWVVGVSAATVVAMLLFADSGADAGDPPVWQVVGRLVLGAVFLVLAVRKFRGSGGSGALPVWMTAVDTMPVARIIALAIGLAALNPKNVAMVLAAADASAGTAASNGERLAALTAFVVLASLSVGLPVLAHLAAPRQMEGPLQDLKEWLVVHNSSVMATLLLVFGVALVGQGLTGF